jgi:Fe-S cluster biosynthesis and repair protein YggX
MMTNRIVTCSKFKKEAPGLDASPFSGELGEEIFQKVSAAAWKEWKDDMMIKVINEYRLNMADEEHYKTLMQQMKSFLGLDDTSKVLEVENAERGRSE